MFALKLHSAHTRMRVPMQIKRYAVQIFFCGTDLHMNEDLLLTPGTPCIVQATSPGTGHVLPAAHLKITLDLTNRSALRISDGRFSKEMTMYV